MRLSDAAGELCERIHAYLTDTANIGDSNDPELFTATQMSRQLGSARTSVLSALNKLERHGRVRSVKIDGNQRGFYDPYLG